MSTHDSLSEITRAFAEPDQPHAVFRAVDRALLQGVSYKLFTILMYDKAVTESIRVYSNLSQDYPLGGRKKIISQDWADQVIHRGVPFIGNTSDDLRRVFSDHALIQALGCESVLNLPVRWNGRTVGTLNLLHERAWYRNADVPALTALAQLAVPGLMLLESA
jgi:transcriptional regulator with GAF, ATPase, and Fis domain